MSDLEHLQLLAVVRAALIVAAYGLVALWRRRIVARREARIRAARSTAQFERPSHFNCRCAVWRSS